MSFAEDVRAGMLAAQKYIPSRYFYDETGDRIFQDIMKMPEYYLTRAEYEILERQSGAILKKAFSHSRAVNIVELGAGDGTKTRLLIKAAFQISQDVQYVPVDISPSVLVQCEMRLREEFINLKINSVAAEYFSALKKLSQEKAKNRLILFLGSNIGNFNPTDRLRFTSELFESLNPGDRVLIGFDLKKDPRKILAAYNDKAGHTRDFNLNLLRRINRELGGNFNLEQFSHFPTYDPLSGRAISFLVSNVAQKVRIEQLDQEFEIQKGESIHTEFSQKFDRDMIKELAAHSGFTVLENFCDSEKLFVDSLWAKDQ